MVKKLLTTLAFIFLTSPSFGFEHEKLNDVIQGGVFRYIITMMPPSIDDQPVIPIGSIEVYDSEFGLILVPKLSQIPAGIHGFHIHENPSCQNKKMDDGKIIIFGNAGGHFDPQKTGKHLGPYGNGHLGDLPAFILPEDLRNSLPILAPRLTANDILGHSIIIHEQADNYSDFPKKLGGGGKRISCGIITKN